MKTTLNFQLPTVETHGRASLQALAAPYCLVRAGFKPAPYCLVRAGFKPAPYRRTAVRLYCLLLLLLATAPAFAQTPDLLVCAGKGYTLMSAPDKDAAGTSPLTFTWYEKAGSGAYNSIAATAASSYYVDAKNTGGTYSYVRKAANAECQGGVPSNTYTWTAVSGTAGAPSGDGNSTYTLTASAIGTYQVQASASVTYDIGGKQKVCTSAPSTATATWALFEGEIDGVPYVPPTHAASDQTWTFGSNTLVWSDRIEYKPANCDESNTFTTETPITAEYTVYDGRYYYSWACVNNNLTNLCPSPWRVPEASDFSTLTSTATKDELLSAWGTGGSLQATSEGKLSGGNYWSSTTAGDNCATALYYGAGGYGTWCDAKYGGYQVRCVK